MPVICFASSFPDRQNSNLTIIDYLVDGMKSVIGKENAYKLPFLTLCDHIEHVKPDAVVLVGSALHHDCDFLSISRVAKKAGTVLGFWNLEDPYEFDYRYRFVDLVDFVFTNDRWAEQFYDRDRVAYIPTASSPLSFRPVGPMSQRPLDVFFCGVAFDVRQRLLSDALLILEKYRTKIFGDGWNDLGSELFQNRRLPPAELLNYYTSTKFVLNIGRDQFLANDQRGLQAVTPGPRTFEAAMAGCVQLCYKPSYEIYNFFKNGDEIISFQTVSELTEQLDHLMENLDEAEEIARRAQKRAMTDHTYAVRAREMLKHLGMEAAEKLSA